MSLQEVVKKTSMKSYLYLIIGVLALVCIQITVYVDSKEYNHFTFLDSETIHIGDIQAFNNIYNFDKEYGDIEGIDYKGSKYLSFSNRNYSSKKDFYNGFGFRGLFNLRKAGYFYINWRSFGIIDEIGIHVADHPPEDIKGKVGEDYILQIYPPGDQWAETKLDINSFMKNEWYQPNNVFDDKLLDITRLELLYFAFLEKGREAKLEIKSIEYRWDNDILIYQLIFSYFIIVGLFLLFRTPIKILRIKNNELELLSYVKYNRLSFMFISFSILFQMLFSHNLEYNNTFILLITIFYTFLLLDDILPVSLNSSRIWSFRYVVLYSAFYIWTNNLNPLSYTLILIFIFIPLVYRRDSLFIILVGLVYILLAFFNMDLSTLSERLFFMGLTVLTFFVLYFMVYRLFFKDNKKTIDNALTLYNGIYLHSSDLIFTISPDGFITSVNRAFTEKIGIEESDCIGKRITKFIDTESHEKFGFLKTEKAINVQRFDAKLGNSKDDSYFIYICENPIFTKSILVGYQIIGTDITQRKIMETALKEANNKLEELANIDGLTQIKNRRYFDEQLSIEIRRANRNYSSLSLLFIDVDYFKYYNDFYGHQLGDDCLIQIALALKNTVNRVSDLVSRYGGEEFVILLPETNVDNAKTVVKLLQQNIKKLKLPHEKSLVDNNITVSIGISSLDMLDKGSLDCKKLIEYADSALYQAKEAGRNRFVVYGTTPK